ncbi:MAG: hypothetical protein ACOYT8_05275 [Candidatus Dependentiae bacterium]
MKYLLTIIFGLLSLFSHASEKKSPVPFIVVVKAYPQQTIFADQSYNKIYFKPLNEVDKEKNIYFNRLKEAVPSHLANHTLAIDDEKEWNDAILQRIELLKK